MFNPSHFENSYAGGVAVLEVVEGNGGQPFQEFVPLRDTTVRGVVMGPLADLVVVHRFGYERSTCDRTLEALYRFPLPGDAAVMAVTVRFGDVEIVAELKERRAAEEEYAQARAGGRQAALATRESADAFSLQVAGLQPDQDIVIETRYVQLARAEGAGWELRIPLTVAPRYTRSDEQGGRPAGGHPLGIARDPGHRFRLELEIPGAGSVTSSTHTLQVEQEGDLQRVSLAGGAVIPDRDCRITWRPAALEARPRLTAFAHHDAAAGQVYFVAQVAPPAMHVRGQGAAREVILLIDHSGSMQGPKWGAADWAVERFLADLTERDRFALAVFHNQTRWFERKTEPATEEARQRAVAWLKAHQETGGTELGVALEQALELKRTSGDLARHLLIITDAEVTDDGRILRLAEREASHSERRRISVLCIDAAPNAYLAQELADRGGGIARFLTSDPEQEDITTALDAVLADWAEPVLTGLTLTVDRPGAEATGRKTTSSASGLSQIDVGDLVSGRSLWVVARAADTGGADLTLTLQGGQQPPLATATLDPSTGRGTPGLKALFGARRVSALEHLMHADYEEDQLRAQLVRLGYDPSSMLGGGRTAEQPVYAENRRDRVREALVPLLRDEALSYHLVSLETAFVATRRESGQLVEGTVAVANALPGGWSPGFLTGQGLPFPSMHDSSPSYTSCFVAGAVGMMPSAPAPGSGPKATGRWMRRRTQSPDPPLGPPTAMDATLYESLEGSTGSREQRTTIFSGTLAWVGPEALLFSTDQTPDLLSEHATILGIQVRAEGLTQERAQQVQLLIHVGDPTRPRAQATLADLLRLGERPLNLRRRPGQLLTVSLSDPRGELAGLTVSLSVELRWRKG